MPKKLYDIEIKPNYRQFFKRPVWNDMIYFDENKRLWFWSNGVQCLLSADDIECEDWHEVFEKHKVEFKKFWKWVCRSYAKGPLEKSRSYYDSKKNNTNNEGGGNSLISKIESDFIVCKKNNETGNWDFVRHSIQEITKEEVENEFN